MSMTVLNDAQRGLVAAHIGVVKWAIYEHISINEGIFGLSYDDLFQEGCLSLCKAATTYDGERAKFITYAQVVVKNGLLTYCTKLDRRIINTISISDLPQEPGDGMGIYTVEASVEYGTSSNHTRLFIRLLIANSIGCAGCSL